MLWMTIVVVVKWHVLLDPPMWDAVFGLFPAAAALADTGFDLPSLLQQPAFFEGGPNCHAESIVTWITAGVLYACGKGQTAFCVLHLLHFAAAAWTLAVLFNFTSQCLGRLEAWLICAALLACPLFSVQTGAMYFEMPLAACAVSALVAYADGQLGRAIVWSIFAVLVKQAGIVVPGALIAAVLLRSDAWSKRLILIATISVPAVSIAVAPLLGTPLLGSFSKRRVFPDWWSFMSYHHMAYLRSIPDISLACVLYVLCGLLLGGRIWTSLRQSPQRLSGESDNSSTEANSTRNAPAKLSPLDSDTGTVGSSLLFSVGFLQLLAFMGFFFVVPFYGHLDFYCLPRYFVFVLPMLFFGLVHVAATVSRRLASAGLVLATMWFVLNRDGTWYPAMQSNNGAIAERAESCRWLAENQRTVVREASRLPADSLLLYGLPEHYFLNHPWMGYAQNRHPGGRCISLPDERPKSLKVADLPDRFFVILDAVILGGTSLHRILHEASEDPSRQVRVVHESSLPPFSVKLYEVSRTAEQHTASKE